MKRRRLLSGAQVCPWISQSAFVVSSADSYVNTVIGTKKAPSTANYREDAGDASI
ncbi:hypothetical protein NBRC111894_4199 [Sporolactobacillus inulinus]|uniref:Uncharacterized protein n=1 Tax=Sporolactobacillus inulinus TaxID=2078 RepID=A0A4Y1ZHN6_9BACL|nr:hypothetical protein NBRC111894_4199 [Sporolactobacillus inulinus]